MAVPPRGVVINEDTTIGIRIRGGIIGHEEAVNLSRLRSWSSTLRVQLIGGHHPVHKHHVDVMVPSLGN
eukprot:2801070-Alexandrium_andersonii.AAC.1